MMQKYQLFVLNDCEFTPTHTFLELDPERQAAISVLRALANATESDVRNVEVDWQDPDLILLSSKVSGNLLSKLVKV